MFSVSSLIIGYGTVTTGPSNCIFTPVNSLAHGLPHSLGMPIPNTQHIHIHIPLPMTHKGMTETGPLFNIQPYGYMNTHIIRQSCIAELKRTLARPSSPFIRIIPRGHYSVNRHQIGTDVSETVHPRRFFTDLVTTTLNMPIMIFTFNGI